MTQLRFFVDVERFLEQDLVSLEEKEFHHARDVVRVGVGESINLINGKGGLATGIIEDIGRRSCTIRVFSVQQEQPRPAQLMIGLSLLRPGHLDFAVEKGTELGIDRFVIFPSHKSEKHGPSTSMERRLQAIAIAATKQSGRLFSPEICIASSLHDALALLPPPRLWADLADDAISLQRALDNLSPAAPCSLLIGPESGWSTDEKTMLRRESVPVRLHHLVLRAETAAIVGAYAMSQHCKRSDDK